MNNRDLTQNQICLNNDDFPIIERMLFDRKMGKDSQDVTNSGFIEIEKIKVYYCGYGKISDPPLIMIHGYGTSSYTWNSTAPLLAKKRFYVIVLDLIGFGVSDKPTEFDYTAESQAQIILSVLKFLKINRASFVGSSYGGAIALMIALDKPEIVEKLILVSPVCDNKIIENFFVGLLCKPALGKIISSVLVSSKFLLKLRLRATFATESYHLINRNYVANIQKPFQTVAGRYAALATLKNWQFDKIQQNISQISQATLIVWGADDKIIKPEIGQKLKILITNSHLLVFPKCGHAPHEEYPQKFVEAVSKHCISEFSLNQIPLQSNNVNEDEKAKKFYDKITPVHQQFFKVNGYSCSIEKYIRLIKSKLPEEISFLDAGCGSGMMTKAFYSAGLRLRQTIALDISHQSLKFARRSIKKNKKISEKDVCLINGDILKLPFVNDSFDVIATCGVLEYVDLSQGLAELSRVLRPSGFIVFVPIRPSLFGKLLEKVYRFKTIHPSHIAQMANENLVVINEYKFTITESIGWSKKIFLLQKKL